MLEGTRRGDGAIEALRTAGLGRLQWSRRVGGHGAWYLPGTRDRVPPFGGDRPQGVIDHGATVLRAAGFEVTVAVDTRPRAIKTCVRSWARPGHMTCRPPCIRSAAASSSAFSGEIDLLTAPAAHTAVEQALPDGGASARIVVVDLPEVRFLSAKGLQLLLDLVDATSERGLELRVVPGTHHSVVWLLEITGIDRVLACSRPASMP